MEKKIDAIYEYTNSILTTNIDTTNKIDTKFTAIIGFVVIFIRLCLDLKPMEDFVYTKTLILITSLFIMMVCTAGLRAKLKGQLRSPEEYLERQIFSKSNTKHQVMICRDRLKAIQEYQKFIRLQAEKINLSIYLFVFNILLYSLALIRFEPLVKNIIKQIFQS